MTQSPRLSFRSVYVKVGLEVPSAWALYTVTLYDSYAAPWFLLFLFNLCCTFMMRALDPGLPGTFTIKS